MAVRTGAGCGVDLTAATLTAVRPLVEPGPPLSAADALRFSRTTVLPQVGEVGQRRLRNARVCVVGAGGLGSPALLYLAAAGVGTLGIVDRDAVDPTNLQRQVVHATSDVGRRKVESAREAVHALDPSVRVEVHDTELEPGHGSELLGRYHLVLDGSDNFPTRYAVNDACVALGIPLVWGAVLGFDAQVSVFWSRPSDGPAVDLRDLFPEPPRQGDVASCVEAGVLGALCGQVGSLMATEAVKMIVGIGEPLLGRVATLDALAARWREVPVRRSPARRAAGVPSQPARAAAATAGACRPHPLRPIPDPGPVSVVTATDLDSRLRAGERMVVVDVREPHEHAAGAIPGAHLLPLASIARGHGLDVLPRDAPMVVYCAGMSRAEEARRLLGEAGLTAAVLEGGVYAWWAHAAGRPEVARSGAVGR